MAFNAGALLHTLGQLQDPDTLQRLPSSLLQDACVQLARLLPLLGPALHFAAWDVNSKLAALRQHLTTFQVAGIQPAAPDGYSLRVLMLFEIKRGAAHSSYERPSLCRTVQRLMWLLDFVDAVATRVVTTQQNNGADAETLKAAVTAAYNDRLRARHRWLVQKAVLLALHACPSRATLYDNLAPTPDAAVDFLRTLAQLLHAPVRAINSIFVEQSLGDLA